MWLAITVLIGKLLPASWSVRKIASYPLDLAFWLRIPMSSTASPLTTECTCVSVLNHCPLATDGRQNMQAAARDDVSASARRRTFIVCSSCNERIPRHGPAGCAARRGVAGWWSGPHAALEDDRQALP